MTVDLEFEQASMSYVTLIGTSKSIADRSQAGQDDLKKDGVDEEEKLECQEINILILQNPVSKESVESKWNYK